jgi:hypothetical protein
MDLLADVTRDLIDLLVDILLAHILSSYQFLEFETGDAGFGVDIDQARLGLEPLLTECLDLLGLQVELFLNLWVVPPLAAPHRHIPHGQALAWAESSLRPDSGWQANQRRHQGDPGQVFQHGFDLLLSYCIF